MATPNTTDAARKGITVRATDLEYEAVEFIARTNPEKYKGQGGEGRGPVLRDYSLTQAVNFYLRAKEQVLGDAGQVGG